MKKLTSTLSVSQLIRVGSKKIIENAWASKTLSFSCAANWIHFNATQRDTKTGDPYECVFSRVLKSKKVVIKDSTGIPIEANIQRISDEESPEYEFLRYVPTMLTPAMCFYSLAGASPNDIFFFAGNENRFYLDKYAEYMGYRSDFAFIIIENAMAFFEELKRQIPLAINANNNILTQKRIYLTNTQQEEWLYGESICYGKHKRFDEFDERPHPPEELFWKFEAYSIQHEVRIIIPHWNFEQEYDPKCPDKYNCNENFLKISLPHLHDYANCIIPHY